MADEIIKHEFINTPFAYTKTQAGLTLLQQNIMVRVSAHMQSYIKRFWQDPDLVASKERPKPIMTQQDLDNMPPMRLDFSELGISASTYSRAKAAIDEIMSVKAEREVIDEKGRRKQLYNVFSKMDIPMHDKGTQVYKNVYDIDPQTGERIKTGDKEWTETDRMLGYVDLTINKDMVTTIFDMSSYVSHPENIARIGKVPNMPLMYYLIRHKMNNFKGDITQARIELQEVRDYLKVDRYDENGKKTKSSYPVYANFKQKILKPSLEEMQKLYDRGEVDVYFTMTEIRPRGKKIGAPSYLVFDLHKRDEKPKKSERKQPVQKSLFTEQQYVPEEKVYEATKYLKEWQETIAEYHGMLKDVILRGKFIGAEKGGYPVVEFTKDDDTTIDANFNEWKKVSDIMKKKCNLYGPYGIQKKRARLS